MHARKVLDLLPDDGNAAFVGGVELENAGAVEFGSVELFGEGEDGGCFACAGGTVEEHVWELYMNISMLHDDDVYAIDFTFEDWSVR